MRTFLGPVAATIICTAGTAGQAATVSTTLSVQAAMLKTCAVSAAPLAFGVYRPGGGAIAAATSVNVACTRTTPFGLGLSGGTTTGGTVAQRLLANGAHTLQYNLYTSSSYATVWGDGSGNSQIQTGTGSGTATPVVFNVYGLLPDSASNQLAAAGNYADTILVVVTF
jgi:spore coat protein U-like protein